MFSALENEVLDGLWSPRVAGAEIVVSVIEPVEISIYVCVAGEELCRCEAVGVYVIGCESVVDGRKEIPCE